MRRFIIAVLWVGIPVSVLAMPFSWQVQDAVPGNLVSVHSDYNQGQVFFAVSSSGQLFRSRNSGDTWSEIATPESKALTLLTRDPAHRESWYAATAADSIHEIWYTSDNGSSWQFRSSHADTIRYISASPIAAGHVLAAFNESDSGSLRVEKSEDAGASWHAVLTTPDPGYPPIWHTTSVWQVHFGTYASYDYGESWENQSSKAVAACGHNIPPSLYALSVQGLFQSQDNLETWWPLLLDPVDVIALNPRNSKMILTGRIQGTDTPVLHYSSNGGTEFSNWTTGLPGSIRHVILGSDWMFFAIADGHLYRYDERPADLDGTNRVDGGDLVILSTAFGTASGEPGFNSNADLNHDGMVDGADLVILSAVFGHRFYYDEDDEPGDFPGTGD